MRNSIKNVLLLFNIKTHSLSVGSMEGGSYPHRYRWNCYNFHCCNSSYCHTQDRELRVSGKTRKNNTNYAIAYAVSVWNHYSTTHIPISQRDPVNPVEQEQ